MGNMDVVGDSNKIVGKRCLVYIFETEKLVK